MKPDKGEALLQALLPICRRAGDEIMAVYRSKIEVTEKADRSPLTAADRLAHKAIADDLAALAPDIPMVSVESDAGTLERRRQWSRFWLVDPLDGTKEFIKRNDEFTVNIALIQDGKPVLGAVWAPALEEGYLGASSGGAWRLDGDKRQPIRVTAPAPATVRVVGSRSHRGQRLDRLLDKLGSHELVATGSSLKICRIAAGIADLYPRLGPTSEWDTAAAQAVLEGAGGAIIDLAGETLRYNKADILNPHFLAYGDRDRDWLELIDETS